jgi:hypothetical protein
VAEIVELPVRQLLAEDAVTEELSRAGLAAARRGGR